MSDLLQLWRSGVGEETLMRMAGCRKPGALRARLERELAEGGAADGRAVERLQAEMERGFLILSEQITRLAGQVESRPPPAPPQPAGNPPKGAESHAPKAPPAGQVPPVPWEARL